MKRATGMLTIALLATTIANAQSAADRPIHQAATVEHYADVVDHGASMQRARRAKRQPSTTCEPRRAPCAPLLNDAPKKKPTPVEAPAREK